MCWFLVPPKFDQVLHQDSRVRCCTRCTQTGRRCWSRGPRNNSHHSILFHRHPAETPHESDLRHQAVGKTAGFHSGQAKVDYGTKQVQLHRQVQTLRVVVCNSSGQRRADYLGNSYTFHPQSRQPEAE